MVLTMASYPDSLAATFQDTFKKDFVQDTVKCEEDGYLKSELNNSNANSRILYDVPCKVNFTIT